jgi:hypothetical protein
MATYSAQITDLIGGTIDQTACDQWAVDGAKEIIIQLPASMQEQASDKTSVTDGTALDFDTATVGKVLYCTRNNGSYDKPCRLISSVYAGLADDSTASNYYAVADDPAYFLRDNKAEIKPTPGSDGAAFYHVVYPSSIDVSADSTIANFPNEADYLVVLYAAVRQLLQYQSTMSTSFNSDIGTAFTAVNTELDETQAICDLINTQADSAVTALGNMATEIALANAQIDEAPAEIVLAQAEVVETATLIDGGIDTAVAAVKTATDLINAEVDKAELEADKAEVEVDAEDMEKAQGYLNTLQGYLKIAQGFSSEAQGYVGEVNARVAQVNGQIAVANGYLATATGYNQVGQAYMQTAQGYGNQASGFISAAGAFVSELAQKIAIANGYIAEANARLGADNTKYQWYGDQYTKLQAQYAAGLAALKGA